MPEQIPHYDEKCPHQIKEDDQCYECDDYRGQRRERRRQAIIDAAHDAAERIILENSNGDSEETDALTSGLMLRYAGQVHNRLHSLMEAHDLRLYVKEHDLARQREQRPTIGGMLDE